MPNFRTKAELDLDMEILRKEYQIKYAKLKQFFERLENPSGSIGQKGFQLAVQSMRDELESRIKILINGRATRS